MDFSTVKQLIIPEGEVKQIAIGGAIVWKKPLYDAQVEYLESDGTQWIDTGISCAAATFGFEGDFSVNSLATTQGIFGCRMQDAQAGNHSYNAFVHNNGMRCDTIGSSSWNYSITADTPIHYVYTPTATTVNGTSQNNLTKTDCTYSFYLFNFHVPSGAYSTGCAQKVYGWKIYVGDTLVRDYVPVRKNGVGYLFDKVSETLFGNQGSGNFALGPDIVPIEYIESTGTQWLDLGVSVSDPSTIAIEVDETVCQQIGFTHQNNVNGTWIARYAPPSVPESLYIYHNIYTNRNVVSANEDRKISKFDGSSGYYENGTQVASFAASVGSDSIANINWCYGAVYDFQMNAVDTSKLRSGKIYSIKIYVSGTLVRDFKPVRAGTTGYLLDKVSGRLFGNKGTGNFVCGGDI